MPNFLKRLFRSQQPRVWKSGNDSKFTSYLQHSRFITVLICALSTLAILFITFTGVKTADIPFHVNQISPVHVVANVPFNYTSTEYTRMLQSQIRDSVPPVYKLEFSQFDKFEARISRLLSELPGSSSEDSSHVEKEIKRIVDNFNAQNGHHINPEDIISLLNSRGAEAFKAAVESALLTLRELYKEGIYDPSSFSLGENRSDQLSFFQGPKGSIDHSRESFLSIEDALRLLRVNIATESPDRPFANTLFRIMRGGVKPNLVFDAEATALREKEAIQNIAPVVIQVQPGQTILERGKRITAEQYEMLLAQRDFLRGQTEVSSDDTLLDFSHLFFIILMVTAAAMSIRMDDHQTLTTNGRITLLSVLILGNLALVRGCYYLGSLPFFREVPSLESLLPYLAPVAIAPIITTLLAGARPAIFVALLISFCSSSLFGNRIDLLAIFLVAPIIAISACRHSSRRTKIIRAGILSGLAVAFSAIFLGVVENIETAAILSDTAAGLVAGLATGIIVIGILPVIETLFRRVTDITLLELTDYNHPLLRLMQIEAPGTYHHSLMVAQLSENAANTIGANPLLARACALYHDIGKIEKPEYFTENQFDGINPHDDNIPSLSALIIKAHVKDGVDIALKYKLPRVIIQVIRQHHGTSLIRYFYHRAQQGAQSPSSPVSETTYRYEGPKPSFSEAAIIHLADSVEAASRSLKKITPQHLGELIDGIFSNSFEDGQLDEAPITFKQLILIKQSFNRTLLNMLHSRIAYPSDEEKTEEEDGENK